MSIKSMLALGASLAAAFAAATAAAQERPGDASPYAGLETREIKSLSEADMEALRRGGGWGLALAAELNGVPGPAHLLELREELDLTEEQAAGIRAIYDDMRREAVAAGERLIAAEAAIETAFRAGRLDETRLRSLIEEAEAARAELRFIHLSRHLSTPPILTDAQIARYNALRGYAEHPCGQAPEGHDPRMQRRHDDCPEPG